MRLKAFTTLGLFSLLTAFVAAQAVPGVQRPAGERSRADQWPREADRKSVV
jgi:hypothetical protein